MSRQWSLIGMVGLFTLAMLLAACGPGTSQVLPTVIDLNVRATTLAEQTATQAAIPTATAPESDLPPSWTPAPPPIAVSSTPRPTASPVAQDVTPTQGVIEMPDRLLFVLDGVIYTVAVDGTGLTPLTGAVDARDLALSPNGRQVAYVGAGLATASEVYVLDLDSGTVLQSSSLGFANVVDPSWHPNGNPLIFVAGQFADGEREIYSVRSNGESLQRLTTLARVGLSEPIFSPDGGAILFSAPGLSLLHIAAGEVTELTVASGWGNDTNAYWQSESDEIVYIRPRQAQEGGYPGGPLHMFVLREGFFVPGVIPPVFMDMYIHQVDFSSDGQWMAYISDIQVLLMEYEARSARLLTTTEGALPYVAVNPDGSWVAFVARNDDGSYQISVIDTARRDAHPVTSVTGQAISDLLWLAAEETE